MVFGLQLIIDCDAALYANLKVTDERAVCIGVGSASTSKTMTATGTTTTSTRTATQTTSTMGPIPTDTVSGCQQFYTVTDSDSCATVLTKSDITLEQFYRWNPSVGSTCTHLWIGEAYCVKGPASTATTSATTMAPTQTGIASNCNKYYTVVAKDSCAKIETTYNITFAELYQWNPAIGSDCEDLEVGYSVCVGIST